MNAKTSNRWILVCAGSALGFMVLLSMLIWRPESWVTWIVCAGVGVFAFLMCFNPERRYWRWATTLYGAAIGTALPSFGVRLPVDQNLEWINVYWHSAGHLTVPLLGAAIVLSLLDFAREEVSAGRQFPLRTTALIAVLVTSGFACLRGLFGRTADTSGHSPGPSASTQANTSIGDNNQGNVVSGNAVSGSMTVNQGLSAAEVESLIAKVLESYDRQLAEKNRELDLLRSAIHRADAMGVAGDPAAEAAIDAARRTGDISLLQQLLNRESDRLATRRQATDENFIAINRELITLLLLQSKFTEAAERAELLLTIAPTDVGTINDLAIAKLRTGQVSEAEFLLKKLLESPSVPIELQGAAYGNLANVYQSRGDFARAEGLHRHALEIHGQFGMVASSAMDCGNLANLYGMKGDAAGSEIWAREGLGINSAHVREETRARLHLTLAIALMDQYKVEQSAVELGKARDLFEKLGYVRELATTKANEAHLSLVRGELDRAETEFREVIELDKPDGPQDATAASYEGLARIFERRGDHAAVIEMCNKGIEVSMLIGDNVGVAKLRRKIENAERELAKSKPAGREATGDNSKN